VWVWYRLYYAFHSSVLAMESKRPPIHLVFDFDGTITTADTTAVVGSAILDKARELASPNVPVHRSPQTMQRYTEVYMQEYRKWKDSHRPVRSGIATLENKIDDISQSKHVEVASFLRVRAAALGTPGAITRLERSEEDRNEVMMNAGRSAVRTGEVDIREPAALKFLLDLGRRPGNDWGIVSVNWSKRFITGVLLEAGLFRDSEVEYMVSRIRANEILAPLAYDINGNPIVVCTAEDKLAESHRLPYDLPAGHAEEGEGPGTGAFSIYVGDSMTDLGCLAKSSVGVYLRQGNDDDPMLTTLKGLSIPCSTLLESPPFHDLCETFENMERPHKPVKPLLIASVGKLEDLCKWISG
jgi:thiamine phosphate phosphatase / amino-HMP aminohydrolase